MFYCNRTTSNCKRGSGCRIRKCCGRNSKLYYTMRLTAFPPRECRTSARAFTPVALHFLRECGECLCGRHHWVCHGRRRVLRHLLDNLRHILFGEFAEHGGQFR